MSEIFIGNLIQNEIKEKRMTYTEFGEKIGLSQSGASNMLKRDSVDCELLLKASLALEHDFFSYYSELLPAEIQKNSIAISNTQNAREAEELKRQLADVKKENSYLKKINELLEKK